jgi:hypothetical protein
MLMYISKKYAQKLQKNLSFVVILEAKLPKKQDPVWRSRIWIRNPVNGSQDPDPDPYCITALKNEKSKCSS